MMSSMWQRWSTPPTSSSNDLLPDSQDANEGQPVIVESYSEDDSLPRQVQVGLSIDYSEYSSKTETSSLSDFEEGMPVWAKDISPARRTSNLEEQQDEPSDRSHSPLVPEDPAPIGLQIPVRLVGDSPHTLTQRSKSSHPAVQQEIQKLVPSFPLLPTKQKRPKWTRIFFVVLALGLVAVSVHNQLDPDLERRGGGTDLRPDLPTFTRRQAPPLATANNQQQVRRFSVAFARASSELPVFGMDDDEESEVFLHVSNSSPLVSFLGGCAFVAILLETGWKGYQKSKYHRSGKSQQQAVRRLYK